MEGYYCKLDTYCISEDYERHPVSTHHYILHETMTDWGLPNRFLQFEIDPTPSASTQDFNFKLASNLQSLIKEKYNWTVNIGYETKEKKKGTLFISNRNNVKGLEFPFVICIMQNVLTNDFSVRSSIYMMLTRSFLTSYLILPSEAINIEVLKQGIEFVNRKDFLRVEEPSEQEKERI